MNFEQLFASGNVAFLIGAIMLAGLAAGACLVFALRAALLQQAWTSIALFLVLSFVFHAMEILQWLRLAKHQPQ